MLKRVFKLSQVERFFLDKVKSGYISVTKDGKVYNNKTKRYIGATGSGRYPKISIKDTDVGVIRHIQIHRLVWMVFKGPIPKGYEINHKDLNNENPALDNLELCTPKENTEHAILNGHFGNRFEKDNEEHRKRKKFGNRFGTFDGRVA